MAMHVIEENARNLVIRFSGAGANTVDVSTLAPPCADLRILKVTYDAPAGAADTTIAGDATAATTLLTLHNHAETMCFKDFGGIVNNAGAGKTGDIIVTIGDASTSLIVWFKKVDVSSAWN